MRILSSLALAALVGACARTIEPPVIPVIGEIPVDQIPGIRRPVVFDSDFDQHPNRIWIGPEYWANRLQDWRLRDGRAECVSTRLPYRTLHLLPERVAARKGSLLVRVVGGALPSDEGVLPDGAFGGLLLGAGDTDLDPRAAALVQSAPGPEGGYLVGVRGGQSLVIRDFQSVPTQQEWSVPIPEGGLNGQAFVIEVDLVADDTMDRGTAAIEAALFPAAALEAAITAADGALDNDFRLADGFSPLVRVQSDPLPEQALAGNLALVAHRNGFWFRDWHAHGTRLDHDNDLRFGPVLAAQHTLSRGTLKMTAQLPPLSPEDEQELLLQTWRDGAWVDLARSGIELPSYTAHFRVNDWPDDQDIKYRLVYGKGEQRELYQGVIRHDPIDHHDELVLAGFTGNHNVRHGFGRAGFPWTRGGLWFPHDDLVKQVRKHHPDVLFFSGDQVYEGASPTFADREQGELDYLYKWFLWCWAFGELTRDTVTITIPDDHDVYQGNLWGQGGRPAKRDHDGGYIMPARFVKLVERTQTSHLPDPWDSGELEQGITTYYTDLVYGRIGFAVLEDRKFKTGPKDVLQHDGPRPDHITDPNFRPADADVPEAVLLGEEQLAFLRHWVEDWTGTDMKAALSQTIFAGMATHHGGNFDRILMDLDSNGWPQSGRNRALDVLRRGFVLMIGGDQHLATLVQHGINDFDDAGFSFCVPSIANFYPRAWRPEGDPVEPLGEGDAPPYTGSYYDGFGNRVTVYAHTNPGTPSGVEPAALHDRMPGYGIVRFRKSSRTMVMECWPRYADPDHDDQYPGWPFQISQLDNYGRKTSTWLPRLRFSGMRDPVVQVIDEFNGEVLYTVRIVDQGLRLPVWEEGSYTLRIGELGTDREKVLGGIRSDPGDEGQLIVNI